MASTSAKRLIKRKAQQSKVKEALDQTTAPPAQKAPTKDAVTAVQERKRVADQLVTSIPGFPPEGKPWSLKQGEGVLVVHANAKDEYGKQTIVLEMDAGSFRWAWEGLEAKALDEFRRFHGTMPVFTSAGARALTVFRNAGHSHWPTKYGNAPKTKKIVRSKSKVIDAAPKRVVKRKKKD
jgi:hypothetical protein